MSYDIYLFGEDDQPLPIDDSLDAEMRALLPMRTSGTSWDSESVNITYNLAPMLRLAGAYPGDLPRRASLAVPVLEEACRRMQADPATYDALSPKNGWGDREGLIEVLDVLAKACRRHPEARIGVS